MNKEEFAKKFLTNTDETGRFIVKSLRTGKTYYVEAIDGNQRNQWGDFDPVTKKFHGDYGAKYKGCIKESESLITEENGFTKIHTLTPETSTESPLSYIDKLDDEYYVEFNNLSRDLNPIFNYQNILLPMCQIILKEIE